MYAAKGQITASYGFEDTSPGTPVTAFMTSQDASKAKPRATATAKPGQADALFQCELCDFTSHHAALIFDHQYKQHGPRALIQDNRNRFECAQCGAVFGRNERLLCHMQCHVGEPGSMVKCFLCPGKFSNEQNLVRHFKTKHSHVETFRCHLCPSKFSRKDNLLAHVRRHANDGMSC